MERQIKKICKEIEKEYDIKILFAIENGSRAWRMESIDSDFDVRFVYYRKKEEYLKIDKPTDVITRAFDKDLKPCKTEGSMIDITGFDIYKYIRLLADSNPTTIEWITTDMIYYGKQNKIFKRFATNNFNPERLFYHYKSMCKNNYIKYIKSKNNITYKRYLYSFRGLLNSLWVLKKNSIPPISFKETILSSSSYIDKKIVDQLNKIITLKQLGNEKEIIKNIPKFDNYIEAFLKKGTILKTLKRIDIEPLNKEIIKILNGQ